MATGERFVKVKGESVVGREVRSVVKQSFSYMLAKLWMDVYHLLRFFNWGTQMCTTVDDGDDNSNNHSNKNKSPSWLVKSVG